MLDRVHCEMEGHPHDTGGGQHCRSVSNIGSTDRDQYVCIRRSTERHDDRLSLSYLCFPFTLDLLRQDQDPDILPLQLALARYVQRYTTEPGLPQCRGCGAKQHVRSLHLPVTSWAWFEVRRGEQLILPSLDISYNPQDTRRTHTLQAIIYLGGHHFTARMRKGPNT